MAKRGLANVPKSERRAIAAKGGSLSTGNFKYDREKARQAGKKGAEERWSE